VSRPARIPLFPLGTVLYPGAVMPLHIFEQRYRDLIADLTASEAGDTGRAFGVIAIREGHEVGREGVRALYEVGTLAVLRGVDPYPDGRYDVVTVGGARFRLLDLDTTSSAYLTADVEILDDLDGDDPQVPAFSVRQRYLAYRAALQGPEAGEPLPDDAGLLSWMVAEGMLLDLPERQRVLAADDTASRLRVQRDLLRRELGLFAELPSLPAVDIARVPMSAN
jgi:Lon protease-like protein